MKKEHAIISILFISAVAVSCNKWVDYSPHDDYRVTDQDYLQSEDDYRSMVVSCYSPLQWLNQMVPVGDIASDNSVAGGENASDILPLQDIDDYNITPNNSTLTDLWKSAYEGINRVNYLTQYKDKNPLGNTISFAGKEAMYGEVYFLRAFYYFSLVKMFGDVPLFADKRLTISDSRTLKRAPKADVYAQIQKDLTDAIAVLPPTPSQPGRITRYAAQALLGKVFLYQDKFDEAAAMLENVVNGPFQLVDDFYSIWLVTGENGPESVFEIQYSNLSPYYNWGGATRGQGNYAVQQNGIRGLSGNSPYAPGWSTNLPTQGLYNAYETGDQRRDATCLDIEKYIAQHPEFNITYQVAPYKNTGLYNRKYLPMKGQTSGQIELNYLNNFRTIRYAGVLLMAAEANARKGTPDEQKSRTYLNRVRRRAFGNDSHNINLSGSALVQAIWNERRLELAMEGERFFDLVRTGEASKVLTGFVVGKNEVFPIPEQEVEISGLEQNKGY